MVRRGVRSVLEQQAGWAVCAEATTGRETVAAAVELRPDVIVLDISMPELNWLEAARQIRHVWPANIIVLTMHDSDELVAEVLDAGARGYVLKSDAGRLLVDAVRAVLEHRPFMTERVSAMVRQTAKGRRGSVGTTQMRLTPREREVLQLLTEARSNKEIGALLGMSTRTAETHRAHIMAKLNLHSVSELVRYAIRNRIIEA